MEEGRGGERGMGRRDRGDRREGGEEAREGVGGEGKGGEKEGGREEGGKLPPAAQLRGPGISNSSTFSFQVFRVKLNSSLRLHPYPFRHPKDVLTSEFDLIWK